MKAYLSLDFMLLLYAAALPSLTPTEATSQGKQSMKWYVLQNKAKPHYRSNIKRKEEQIEKGRARSINL
jgi:hypothetical protein